ncbi:MAG: hypothetical protein AAF787_20530, partial [Chloroflexota bacterium]
VYAEGEPLTDADLQAIQIELAYDEDLIDDPVPLADLDEQARVRAVKTVAGFLKQWNPVTRENTRLSGLLSFRELIDLAGYTGGSHSRIKDGLTGRLQLGDDIKRRMLVSFGKVNLPNPIFFALNDVEDLLEEEITVHVPVGSVHGDLHALNLLFPPENQQNLTVIDFGKADGVLPDGTGKERPLFFDWVYLELDLLLRNRKFNTYEDWKDWRNLVKKLCKYDTPYTLPEDSRNAHIPLEIRALRAELEDIYSPLMGRVKSDVLRGYWATASAVGINFARKTGQTMLHRTAALWYATYCLKQLFALSDIDVDDLPNDEAHPIGPYEYGFWPQKYDSRRDKRIFITGTDDCGDNLKEIQNGAASAVYSQSDNLAAGARIRRMDMQPRYDNMSSRQFFFAIIGKEKPDIRHKFTVDVWTYDHTSQWDCEIVQAAIPLPGDCCVMIEEGAEMNLSPHHPIMRGSTHISRCIERFTERDQISRKFKILEMRWIGFPIPVNWPRLFRKLPWQGLGDVDIDQADGNASIIQFNIPDDTSPDALGAMWNWLEKGITDHHADALGTERDFCRSIDLAGEDGKDADNPLTPGFRSFLLSRRKIKDAGEYKSNEDLVNMLVREFHEWLLEGNGFLFLRKVGPYHDEVTKMWQAVSRRLDEKADVYYGNKLYLVVLGENPVDIHADVSLNIAEDFTIGAAKFNRLWRKRPENFVLLLTDPELKRQAQGIDWSAVLFEGQDAVSPATFVQRILNKRDELQKIETPEGEH